MGVGLWSPLKGMARVAVDFALPPRCAGCGTVADEPDAFCPTCWPSLDWIGQGGCERCGLPLAATEAAMCGRCLADPPGLDRIRAALAYDELPRQVALKLKYGRKVGLARTMARYMAPLKGERPGEALVMPVPLHRSRLWTRGFNQAGLVARELGRIWKYPVDPYMLERTRKTPPLKGMSGSERKRTVAGAFRLRDGVSVKGRDVILVDDVFTTGSTAEACAKVLHRGGARQVELICWARVVHPAQLMR
ncbi:ComF family protein [Sphingomonas jaspsi]|uniref:ComF family protein n=1 Tax=Sphingomonas jaspsi TaxID=392409 RepID=UPI00056BEC76|nr:ComF family protein [Sphingomonas jaspsi]